MMFWMKHLRIMLAVVSAVVVAVSGLCLNVWQPDFEGMPAVKDIITSMSYDSTTLVSQPQPVEEKSLEYFREEQRNKMQMLKKRFDGLETSVAKIDALEKSMERIEDVLKNLVTSASRSALESARMDHKKSLSESSETQCNFRDVQGTWTPSWKWMNHGCSTELDEEVIEKCMAKFSKIVFLGDSQMYHLYRTFVRSMSPRTCEEIKWGGRCGQIETYFGLKSISEEKYVKPVAEELEGPITYGKSHPGCTDCSGCDLGTVNCTDSQGHLLMEYLAVEFAKDVELQSTEAGTTQENVAIYLSRSKVKPSIVVFNVGLHDSQVLEDGSLGASEPMSSTNYKITHEMYGKNLRWFVEILHRYLPSTEFVFITTTPKNRKFYVVNEYANPLIENMNKNAREIISSFGDKLVDVYPLIQSEESKTLFSDEVHFHQQGGAYYKTVRHLVLRQACFS